MVRALNKAGMTLVEILLVMVIIGIMLAIGLPRMSAMRTGIQIDGAAQQLAGDLRRAQVEAIRWNRSIALTTGGLGTSTYTVDSVGARSFDGGVTFGVGSSAFIRMAPYGPPAGLIGATFVLRLGMRSKTITVSPAGLVSVK